MSLIAGLVGNKLRQTKKYYLCDLNLSQIYKLNRMPQAKKPISTFNKFYYDVQVTKIISLGILNKAHETD
jgi:hypothetical protein